MAIITISRGSFAGGRALAEKLGERLDQPVLSREQVLAETAKQFGIEEAELAAVLNESPPYWQQVSGKRLAYVKCVTAVLLDHASRGSLLYHGHVAHLLLGSIPHVLRVRVIADMAFRIRAAMEQAGLTRDGAIAYIKNVDEERSRWARLLYGVDWEDPAQYSVVLNLAHMTMEGACETIVRMAELDDFKANEEGRKKLEDLQLSCRVWAALAKNPETRSAALEVTADDGEVLIQGSVGSTSAAELVPQIAEDVEGVRKVRSEAGMGTDLYW